MPAYFEGTDELAPEQVARDVAEVVGRARARGYKASGLFQVTTDVSGIANTKGLAGFHRATDVDYSSTLHGPNGSGKAAQAANDYGRIDVAGLAATALDNAVLAQDPRPLAPGDYTVILEPAAVVGLLAFLTFTMSARDADEGTTAFAGTVGSRLVSEKVTLRLPTEDPEVPAAPFGEAGLAVRPTTWIERGVVRRLAHSRYWAARQGVEPDPAHFPLVMDGEEGSAEDLVRDCRRGLLVKNLWYIRFVDRKSLVLTGMTRDGLFLVEDGQVTRPVQNMRWNESPITFLRNVVGLSRAERVNGWGTYKVPAVMSEGFTFTSTTESV
jgi:predicted Zn-dependent protease